MITRPLTTIAALLALAAPAAAQTRDLAAEMDAIQFILPMQIDADSTLIEAAYADRQILFRYNMADNYVPLESMTHEAEIFRPAVLPVACEGWGDLLASGELVAINYVWEFKGDSGTATYTSEDCRGKIKR